MKQFAANNLIQLTLAVTVVSGGAAIDPSTVTLSLRNPDGTITNLNASIVKDSTGNYHANTTPTQGGVYTYEWTGTGAAVVQATDNFLVTPAPF